MLSGLVRLIIVRAQQQTMRLLKPKLIVFSLCIFFALPSSQMLGQRNSVREDYGKFCLSFDFFAEFSLQLFDSPNRDTKPMAQFVVYKEQTGRNSYVRGVSKIRYYQNKKVVKPRVVYELIHGGTYGIAGLEYSADSQWIKISLDNHNFMNPSSAWISISDVKKIGISILSWKEFYKGMRSLYFRYDSAVKFYSRRSFNSYINSLTKKVQYNNFDYSMDVIQSTDEWMEVYLYCPSIFGEEDKQVKQRNVSNPPEKVWIRYLDDNGRPQLWYMWE
jgi:hypothetical protein